jgi:hypothetical protein
MTEMRLLRYLPGEQPGEPGDDAVDADIPVTVHDDRGRGVIWPVGSAAQLPGYASPSGRLRMTSVRRTNSRASSRRVGVSAETIT